VDTFIAPLRRYRRDVCYTPGLSKHPDASFRLQILPDPSRQNGLMYQPGTTQHYPTFVLEVAESDEERDRLPWGVSNKYFQMCTSLLAWLGIKIDTAPPQRF